MNTIQIPSRTAPKSSLTGTADARVVKTVGSTNEMCGRITLKVSPGELQELFDVVRGLDTVDYSPRYNVAPTTQMICIRGTDAGREVFPARWGLIPSWAKDTKISGSTFNAKSETVAEKPMFRSAFKSRRCLVIASGFYEWEKLSSKEKQPHYITLKSGEPMALAGLWETRRARDGESVQSCTVCTTSANPFMMEFHDRMPVILPHSTVELWLDLELKNPEKLKPILAQFLSNEMQEWPVAKDVGNVRNQGSQLIEPLGR